MTIEEERGDPRAGDAPDEAPPSPPEEAPGSAAEEAVESRPEEAGSEEAGSADVKARAEAGDAEARDAALPTTDEPESAEVDDADTATREPSADAPPGARPGEVGDREVPAQAPGDQATGETSEAAPSGPPPRERRASAKGDAGEQPEVVPGADLEPDLVLDEPKGPRDEDEYGDAAYAARYAEPEVEEAPTQADEVPADAEQVQQATAPRSPMELAADARYLATGKRKTSVARVILKPGTGTYTVNGRALDEFFPRPGLQNTARQPLIAAGYEARMDVVARLHGGGVSSQAGALRHGVARALADADPSLRGELKRRGYLTRDPRAKERKKAGLKKARKRPQFSKR